MSGTMVSDQGYLPENKRFRLLAHEALVAGRVVAIDTTSIGADSGLPDTTADATAGAGDEILGVAERAIASGDRGWITVKGLVNCSVAADAAQGVALTLDDSDITRLDDAAHAVGEVMKIVGYAQTAVGASDGEVLVFFDGEGGFGTAHAAV